MTEHGDHPNLKITDIEIYPLDIALREPFRIATMVSERTTNFLVHILTNQGVTGWGEGSPAHSITGETQGICLAAAREIKPLLIGKNPLEIAALVKELDRFLPHNETTKSAFDLALFDIAAKVAGMPLYRFLGGTRRPMETDYTIGLCPPDECAARALKILAEGFDIVKVKVGTTKEEDCRRLRSVREAVGFGPKIRMDANQGWDRMTAIAVHEAVADLDIEFSEQPVRADDPGALRYVSQRSPIPVMADESLFSPAHALQLAAEEACAYFNIKLAKAGGIANALKIASIAEAAGIACMIGCMDETRLGLAAAAHFACANDIVRFFDLDMCLMHGENPIDGGIEVENGMISLPDTPGLGAEPSRETRRRLVRFA